MKTSASRAAVLLAGAASLYAAPAWTQECFVIMPDAAVRHGMARRQGPFPSEEAAGKYWTESKLLGNAKIECEPESDSAAESASGAESETQRRIDEAAARAERDRLARQEAERRRKREFEARQKSAAAQLKGVSGNAPTLKTGGNKLDDSVPMLGGRGGVGDTGIKEARSEAVRRDLGGREAAWKQMHGAVELARLATAAPDADEAYYLAEQAFRAANGDPLGVVLSPPSPMPVWSPDKEPPPEYHAARDLLHKRLRKQVEVLLAQEKVHKERAADLKAATAALKAAEESAAPPPAAEPRQDARALVEAALSAARAAEIAARRAAEQAQIDAVATTSRINATAQSANSLEHNPEQLAATMLAQLEAP